MLHLNGWGVAPQPHPGQAAIRGGRGPQPSRCALQRGMRLPPVSTTKELHSTPPGQADRAQSARLASIRAMLAARKVIHRFSGTIAEDLSTKLRAWRAEPYFSGRLVLRAFSFPGETRELTRRSPVTTPERLVIGMLRSNVKEIGSRVLTHIPDRIIDWGRAAWCISCCEIQPRVWQVLHT